MSDLLGLGANAIRAYRGALETVGNNVANAQTEGYSRRRVTLDEYRPASNMSAGYRSTVGGYGVRASGMTRAEDAFAANEYRTAIADAAGSHARMRWLETVELALNNGGGGTVGEALTGVYNAATTLAADPRNMTLRTQFLSGLNGAATQFQRTASAMERASPAIIDMASDATTALNTALVQLHSTNKALLVAGEGTGVRLSLEDDRDAALAAVARYIGIDVSLDQRGVASVAVAGSSGSTLLDANGPKQVGVIAASDGRFVININGGVVAPASGELAALSQVAQDVAQRRLELDQLAADFVGQINGWSAGGVDRNGAAGTALMAGTNGTSIAVAVTDPALVPAAQSSGAANANLLTLEGLRTTDDMEGRWAAMTGGNASALFAARGEAEATADLRDGRLAVLDAVTGIDLDTEAAELVRYEQAYNASSRIVQVARETFNTIFNIF
jgi:flagellar hook-associated protein 1